MSKDVTESTTSFDNLPDGRSVQVTDTTFSDGSSKTDYYSPNGFAANHDHAVVDGDGNLTYLRENGEVKADSKSGKML